MSDVFDEVEVQMRQERWTRAFARAWPWLAALLVVLLLAVAGFFLLRNWRDSQAHEASANYQRGIDTLVRQTGDPAANRRAADAQFAQVADSGASGYAALALMQRAAIALENNNAAQAVRYFDQAAGATDQPVLADAAGLQAAYALMDTAALPELERRLRPLAAEGRPYRPLAREALAIALAVAGRTADARRELVVLSLSEDSPQGLRTRAQANLQVLDSGGAAALRDIARAASTVPASVVQAYAAQQAQQSQAAQLQAQIQAAQAQAQAQGGGQPAGPASSGPAQ